MSQGWECPRCGEVYGPAVEKCTNPDCKKKPKVKKEEGGEELGDPVSGKDLHDALYEETIVFPQSGGGKKSRRGGGEGSGGLW